jgi:hypothetical protein
MNRDNGCGDCPAVERRYDGAERTDAGSGIVSEKSPPAPRLSNELAILNDG